MVEPATDELASEDDCVILKFETALEEFGYVTEEPSTCLGTKGLADTRVNKDTSPAIWNCIPDLRRVGRGRRGEDVEG